MKFQPTLIEKGQEYRYTGGATERFAGNIGYKFENSYVEYTIHSIDDFDKDWTSDYKLKLGEVFFRCRSRVSDISCPGGFIVKVNIERGLIYFLSLHGQESDILDFERKGIKLNYLNIVNQ
jgi:hypothetical protein